MKTNNFQPRLYRFQMGGELLYSFVISYRETDLWVAVNTAAYSETLKQRLQVVAISLYRELEQYLDCDPTFLHSLTPHQPLASCPQIAQVMATAASQVGVGPMATVAGAFSETIGQLLIQEFGCTDVIIENGGDIFMQSTVSRRLAIFAGSSPLSNKLGLELAPELTPLGICTSSGTVGHSLSFGNADSVTVLCKNTALADAYATRIGNMVKTADSLEAALNFSATQPEIIGIVIIIGDRVGFRGNLKIIKICE